LTTLRQQQREKDFRLFGKLPKDVLSVIENTTLTLKFNEGSLSDHVKRGLVNIENMHRKNSGNSRDFVPEYLLPALAQEFKRELIENMKIFRNSRKNHGFSEYGRPQDLVMLTVYQGTDFAEFIKDIADTEYAVFADQKQILNRAVWSHYTNPTQFLKEVLSGASGDQKGHFLRESDNILTPLVPNEPETT